MLHSLKTTWLFAKTQLKRNFRDPITTIVLFGIPVLLVLVFGSLTRNADNISVRVAIVNNSNTQFSQDFEKSLKDIKALKLPDKQLTLDQARDEMNNDALDGIIELPEGFGTLENTMPTGKVRVYFDQADQSSGDIVASIMQSVVTEANKRIAQVPAPLAIERTPLNVTQASVFDNIYAMFTGMAIMMVGVFAVASVFPTDKKTGVLRRMHVTPIRAREVIIGTMLAFAVIGLVGVALLTAIAIFMYDFNMRGDWLTYGIFILLSLLTMLGFGLAIGGVAKNSTQSDILGQIVFIASLAVSGVWFPRALLPEFMQNITAFFPLTPVIEGIRAITTEGATLMMLLPEIGIIAAWGVVVYTIGIRVFRWS